MSDENEAVVRQAIDACNRGDHAALSRLVTPDCIAHTSWGAHTMDGWKVSQASLRTAFPDTVVTVDDIVAKGNNVAARYTIQGTHRRACKAVAATGKLTTIRAMGMWRINDGRIEEFWVQLDLFDALQRSGAIRL